MKKSKIIIILILIVFIMGTFVFAVKEQAKSKAKEFLSVDKEKASIGDIVTLTLDLAQINYDEFVLTIQADKQILNNSEINTKINSNNEEGISVIEKEAITLEKENDVTMKLFADKQNLSSEEIKLCFVVPESLNIGDKINLHATIEEIQNTDNNETPNRNSAEVENTTKENSLEEEKNVETNENNAEEEINTKTDKNSIDDGNVTNTNENSVKENNSSNTNVDNDKQKKIQEESKQIDSNKENELKETTITITIIEKTNTPNNIDANAINLENVFKEQSSTKRSSASSSSTSTSNSSKSTSNNNTAETYKGSSNKYLSNIEVDGYQLTPNFNITNTTYFLEVESNVTTLNIRTEKYDSSEIVTIYGNEELKTGTNKILINVTAEDGSTKIYRIYVTKK